MTARLKQRQRKFKVHKHMAYGRTYDVVEGVGYKHYTKGYRKSSMTASIMDKGSKALYALIDKAFPKTTDEKVVEDA